MALILNTLESSKEQQATVNDQGLLTINVVVLSIPVTTHSSVDAVDESALATINALVADWRKSEQLNNIQSIKNEIIALESEMAEISADRKSTRKAARRDGEGGEREINALNGNLNSVLPEDENLRGQRREKYDDGIA
jgi:hypothetical protein